MAKEDFVSDISHGYEFEGKSIVIGGAMYKGDSISNLLVKIPLSSINRHGLISGATGSGKTKSLQVMAEGLSQSGVPVMLMDVKGDLSGLAMPGSPHPKIDERHQKIGLAYTPSASPVELMTLIDEPGTRLRATLTEFGPLLLSKILDLNNTQSSIVTVVFKYCDDNKIPLVDLKDFKKAMQFMLNEGKDEVKREYGNISSVSAGSILRKMIALEELGAEEIFGEPSFEIADLMRLTSTGEGIISILRLENVQDRPKIFSTFMLQMLAELYYSLTEQGDTEKPSLVVFIDEAHLIFHDAEPALMDQIEVMVKLIRSKGVGLYFVTQNPTDIPNVVLSQLGMKIQHSLRAFTAKDRKAIKLVAQNYPLTDHYDIEKLITELGIGEALISVLNEDGIPTPLVRTMMRAPKSRMGILTSVEVKNIVEKSNIAEQYNKALDRQSAYEILTKKIEEVQSEKAQEELKRDEEKRQNSSRGKHKEKSTFEKVVNHTTTRQIGRTIARELTRGILGILGIETTRRRRKKRNY